MDKVTELKVKGYDLIAQYEQVLSYAEQLKAMIGENAKEIEKLTKEQGEEPKKED